MVDGKNRRGRRTRRAARFAALAILGAACGDDPTGPRSVSDIERANHEFAAVRAELVANTDVAVDLAHVRPALDTLGLPLPAELRGTTFEWDAARDGYVATARGGAPADGLRFLLYDRMTTPLAEIGFVDVTDESDASAEPLGVHLEKEDITRLDYLIEASSSSSGDVSAAGFLSGGTERVDFDVAQVVSVTSGGFRVDLDYSLSLAGRPLALELDYTLNLSLTTPDARFVATFVDGADELVIDLTQDAQNTIEGTVEWNGQVVMTVTDDGEGQPVFLGPEGEEPAPGDARAIRSLFEFASDGVGYLLPYLIIHDDDLARSRLESRPGETTAPRATFYIRAR